jgi:hypothetical protein
MLDRGRGKSLDGVQGLHPRRAVDPGTTARTCRHRADPRPRRVYAASSPASLGMN